MTTRILLALLESQWLLTLSVLQIGCDEEDNKGDDSASVDTETSEETDTATATEMEYMVFCPKGSEEHTSSSGKTFCCPQKAPLFCDETSDGYEGGCWEEEADCSTLIECGGEWIACPEESLSYCDDDGQVVCISCPKSSEKYETSQGMPVCCPKDFPVFCDAMSNGYEGGCWGAGIDCDTIDTCQDEWRACPEGTTLLCDTENNVFGCAM